MAKSNRASGGSQPAQEEIALRAYELYQERGSVPGHETDDWLQAEAELSAQGGENEGDRPREAPARRASSESAGGRRDGGGRRSLRQ